MHGFAANRELVEHYIEAFGAVHLGLLHTYQILIEEDAAKRLLEVYTYEWD